MCVVKLTHAGLAIEHKNQFSSLRHSTKLGYCAPEQAVALYCVQGSTHISHAKASWLGRKRHIHKLASQLASIYARLELLNGFLAAEASSQSSLPPCQAFLLLRINLFILRLDLDMPLTHADMFFSNVQCGAAWPQLLMMAYIVPPLVFMSVTHVIVKPSIRWAKRSREKAQRALVSRGAASEESVSPD